MRDRERSMTRGLLEKQGMCDRNFHRVRERERESDLGEREEKGDRREGREGQRECFLCSLFLIFYFILYLFIYFTIFQNIFSYSF